VSARLEDGALVVRIGSARRVVLVLGAVAFVVASLLLIASGRPIPIVAGVLGVLTFGAFAVIGLVQIARGPSQLVLTPRWLRWDAGFTGREVAWEDVVRVDRWQHRGQSVLAVHVARPEDVHRTFAARLLARANRSLGAGDVNVPLNHLAVDKDLLQSIVELCARDPGARAAVATEATVRRLQA
jgi:hypothetical protein